MTIFDAKLTQMRRRGVDNATIGQLDELQEAFKRLGSRSQQENLKDLRCAATNSNGLDDLADLLENVAKKPGSRPRRRPSRSNSGAHTAPY